MSGITALPLLGISSLTTPTNTTLATSAPTVEKKGFFANLFGGDKTEKATTQKVKAEKEKVTKVKAGKMEKDPVAQASLWGGIAGAASSIVSSGVSLTGMLNKDVRESNLAIAEANARTAEAQNQNSQQLFGIDKKYLLIVGGALLALVIGIVFISKKNG